MKTNDNEILIDVKCVRNCGGFRIKKNGEKSYPGSMSLTFPPALRNHPICKNKARAAIFLNRENNDIILRVIEEIPLNKKAGE